MRQNTKTLQADAQRAYGTAKLFGEGAPEMLTVERAASGC